MVVDAGGSVAGTGFDGVEGVFGVVGVFGVTGVFGTSGAGVEVLGSGLLKYHHPRPAAVDENIHIIHTTIANTIALFLSIYSLVNKIRGAVLFQLR